MPAGTCPSYQSSRKRSTVSRTRWYTLAVARTSLIVVRDDEGNLHIGIPMKFRDEPGRVDPRLPGVGEHTAEVLREAGCDEALIAAVLAGR